MSMSAPDTNNVTDVVTSGSAVETVPGAQGGTTAEPKFTAEQVEKKCPERLRDIGKLIAARLEKIDKQIEQAENHSISVNQLITQAKALCDEGGFNAFREKFFPNLGKSRVYELLAIGTSKKSVEEVKARTRARVAKYRANKAASSVSVTVTDNSELEMPGVPTKGCAPKQMSEPAKPRSAVAPGDEALRAFTVQVLELNRRTDKRPPKRFAATAVPVEVLARLGKLLTDVANLKKSDAVEAAPAVVLPGTASDEQPVADITTARPVQHAEAFRP
jgi:hypothetical protein